MSTPHSAHPNPHFLSLTRRALLQSAGMGVGSLALRSLLAEEPSLPGTADLPSSARAALASKSGNPSARAKSIIFLHMVGAPSQLDLFDYKPTLQEYDGQPVPKHLIEGQRFAFLRGHPELLGTKF